MDFTLTTYKKLLNTLKSKGYTFQPFADAIENPRPNTIILRHDVDLHPENALRTARIEHSLGIRSTYFFRIIPETFKPEIIRQIADLNHEIGYHYEDMTLAAGSAGSRQYAESSNREEVRSRKYEVSSKKDCSKQKAETSDEESIEEGTGKSAEGIPFRGPRGKRGKTEAGDRRQAAGESSNGEEVRSRKYEVSSKKAYSKQSRDAIHRVLNVIKSKNKTPENKTTLIDHAYQLFCHHLEQLRQYAEIKTICMHGSPKSKYDSRDIWNRYDYRKLGIIGEPYFDIDFDEVFYLTDTGRRWDGWKVSLRDKVPQQEQWEKEGLVFHTTKDIIKAAHQNKLPDKIMITTHPQRWTDRPLPWMKEWILQNLKNIVKRILVASEK